MIKKIANWFLLKVMEYGLLGGFFILLRKIILFVLKMLFSVIRMVYRFVVRIIKKFFNCMLELAKKADPVITRSIRNAMMNKIPVDDKKILFLTFQGDYTCNPKAIAQELLRENPGYRLVWDVKSDIPTSEYPLGLEFVRHGTLEFYKELASAKIIIENTNIVERLQVPKKKGQYLLQTWHGSLGIKRLDGAVVMGAKWKAIAKACQKNVDYLLSNSAFETEVFETSYWKGVPSLLVGHARNDIFFADEERKAKIRKKVYRQLEIPEDRKICLFAPTHRDNVGEKYQPLDYKQVKEALEERFGGEWQIVIRLHNRLKKKSARWIKRLPDYVSNGTLYEDMQELLVATEVGITDYSSWIFDYVLSEKPGFIVKLGAEDFENQRGFYYPIETTPFPVSEDSEGLVANIRVFDEKKYVEDTKRFLEERGCMEDGHASERIAAKIKELMGNPV